MALDPALHLRPFTLDELPSMSRMVNAVFLDDQHDDEVEIESGIFEPERSIAIFAGSEPISTAAAYSRDLTVPGGPLAIAAVTWVAVAQTERRRGLLTEMMRHQLADLHDNAREPVAVLWASEAAIYGRFGYGQASLNARLTVSTAELSIRREVDRGSGQLRQCSAQDAVPAMRSVYERARVERVGHLDRRGKWWDRRLFDPERWRDGAGALRFLIHTDGSGDPDGYAIFNVKGTWGSGGPRGEVAIRDMAATTPAAYAAVWGFFIEMDLVRQVRWDRATTDEPLRYIVDNPAALQLEVTDQLWLRVVDVDRALRARRYSAPIDMVLEVTDEFCPWNTGRYRLTGDDGTATCVRTDDAADIALSAKTLGAAYLGGATLGALAAAGLVTEHRPGALAAASTAFATARQPNCPEVF